MRGTRLNPGWLTALFAAVLSVSVWLPWHGGPGPAGAIGGDGTAQFGVGQVIVLLASVLVVAGAMAARRIFTGAAAGAAVAVSLLLIGAESWFYRLSIGDLASARYGFYLGVAGTVAALSCSVWSLTALRASDD